MADRLGQSRRARARRVAMLNARLDAIEAAACAADRAARGMLRKLGAYEAASRYPLRWDIWA